MCGIAGRYSSNFLTIDPEWHKQVIDLLKHRGPDGQGYYSDKKCELVHRRLAILDTSDAGLQPMSSKDGSIVIVFNGEIYNYLEIKENLIKKNYIFSNKTDTEVLIYLYEEYGQEMVNHIRGMFAFVIYDKRKRKLFVARDRFGIKPLYYALVDGTFIFGSEIKAILALKNFPKQINKQGCYDYLGLSYVPEPVTAFKNIHVFPKGHIGTVDDNGFFLKSYYATEINVDFNQNIYSFSSKAENLLNQALKVQLEADVRVGSLLSGGIDSSLIVAGCQNISKKQIDTFSVGFSDKEYDESELAKLVAKHCQTNHTTLEMESESISPEKILDLLVHFDQPFADTSLIPTYFVCKAIREQGILCALSGDGGDEAFGGYARFWRANLISNLAKIPSPVRPRIICLGAKMQSLTKNLGRQLAKVFQLIHNSQGDQAILLAGFSSWLSESEKKSLIQGDANDVFLSAHRLFKIFNTTKNFDLESISQNMTRNLFDISLTSDMLRKVDMMSMLTGLEVRVPFLDERIVDLGLTLPHNFKTNGQKGKLVLRTLAKKYLPKKIANHKKQGFMIPMDRIATSKFYEMLHDLLLARDTRIKSFLNMNQVSEWINLFTNKKKPKSNSISRGGLYQRIFIILALEVWLRKHRLNW